MTSLPCASCPDHPLRRLLPLLFLGLTLAAAVPGRAHAETAPAVSVLAQVAPLRQGQLAQTVHALGSVTTASSQTLAIAFPRQVQVRQVLVRMGQRVKQGQPLLTVQTAPGADLAYTQARNAVRYAQADLQRVQQLASQQLATGRQQKQGCDNGGQRKVFRHGDKHHDGIQPMGVRTEQNGIVE